VATSNDHPGLPFVQAEGYTKGRPDGPPLWVVIHDMEASEHSGRAESTAAYFANPPDGRSVSSHFCVDNDSVVQCVDEDDIAWTVGNRPGNYLGLNWELSGFARQTRSEWLDPFGVAMFAQMAPIAAASMRRWGIPNRWCSIADLQARRPGLTTHNDLRIAFNVTTHTDPGPNFPFDYLQQVLEAALNPPPEAPMAVLFIVTDETPADKVCVSDFSTRRWLTPTELNKVMAKTGLPFPSERLTSAAANELYGPDIETLRGKQGPAGPPGPATLVPHTHAVSATSGPADAVVSRQRQPEGEG
jgi:hypothetical protein